MRGYDVVLETDLNEGYEKKDGVNVMNHKDKAVDYYNHNFNCSQGVFTAFATEMGVDEKLALRIATNFGGGARKGELCGAVVGALMVLGLRCGHCESEDAEGKAKAYAASAEFMNRFAQKHGSVVCRELLGYDHTKKEDMAIIEEQNLFRTFCPKMVESAAQILDEMISEGLC